MSFLFSNKRKRGLRLIEAVKKGEKGKLAELLQREIEIDAADENGDTSFMWGVLKGNKEVLVQLLRHVPPPDWDHKNNNGFTPLMFAAGKGHVEIVQILLDLKDPSIDITHKNKVGQTALDYARKNGFGEIADMIRKRGGRSSSGQKQDNGVSSSNKPGYDLKDALQDPSLSETKQPYEPPSPEPQPNASPGPSTRVVQNGPNKDEPTIDLDAAAVGPKIPNAGSGRYAAAKRRAKSPKISNRNGDERRQKDRDHERKDREHREQPKKIRPRKHSGRHSRLAESLTVNGTSLTLEKIPANKLGEGGCGIVWKGEYLMMPVAVKELKGCASLSAKKDFMDEINLQSRLKYPRIINVIGVLVQNEDLLLITEYCPLKSMCDVFHGKLRPQLIKNWNIRKRMAIEAAQGMAYLHERNILHLDIKPLNLMVDEDLHIKVGDFGISKFLSTEQTVKAKGWTPTYVSPEVMTGKPFGKPADIYSFAIVLYEIFTMWDPYCDANCNAQVLLTKIAMGTRPTVPDALPQAQRDLLNQAWHKDPDKRPTFIELLEELNKL